MKRIWITLIFFQMFSFVFAQDLFYVKSVVDTLCHPEMHGRGYVDAGDKKAAEYIKQEFINNGLENFQNQYFQSFNMPINTFPDTLKVITSKRVLQAAKDFMLLANSPSVSDTFQLIWFLMDSLGNPQLQGDYGMIDISDKVIVTDMSLRDFKDDNFNSKGVIFLSDKKLSWWISNGFEQKPYFQMVVNNESLSMEDEWIFIDAQAVFHEAYSTQNVVAWVQGKKQSNDFFVFTAHYDHLGRMGAETYFPGANDNASGTAMVLDLARHFSLKENQPDFNMAFILFSGEEAGLLGSTYYANHPLFPLENIKFLINLDMVASGSKGIKVVNGSIFQKEFTQLVQINTENEYILKVSERGEAANSDHYPFYNKGVPAVFIYTLGDECKEYHHPDDNPDNTPFTEYKDVFHLLTDFIETF